MWLAKQCSDNQQIPGSSQPLIFLGKKKKFWLINLLWSSKLRFRSITDNIYILHEKKRKKSACVLRPEGPRRLFNVLNLWTEGWRYVDRVQQVFQWNEIDGLEALGNHISWHCRIFRVTLRWDVLVKSVIYFQHCVLFRGKSAWTCSPETCQEAKWFAKGQEKWRWFICCCQKAERCRNNETEAKESQRKNGL